MDDLLVGVGTQKTEEGSRWHERVYKRKIRKRCGQNNAGGKSSQAMHTYTRSATDECKEGWWARRAWREPVVAVTFTVIIMNLPLSNG